MVDGDRAKTVGRIPSNGAPAILLTMPIGAMGAEREKFGRHDASLHFSGIGKRTGPLAVIATVSGPIQRYGG